MERNYEPWLKRKEIHRGKKKQMQERRMVKYILRLSAIEKGKGKKSAPAQLGFNEIMQNTDTYSLGWCQRSTGRS